MNEVVTFTDLDKEFRRETFKLLHQLEVGRMNATIFGDSMKALAFSHNSNASRILGKRDNQNGA